MRTFRAILARESVETDEGWLTRVFPSGCFQWGEGPWPITVHHDDGAIEGTVLGQAQRIERLGDLIIGYGFLDDEGIGSSADLRRDIVRQIDLGLFNSISVEPAGLDVTEECTETDEDGWCTALRVTFERYEIGVASVVTIPAIEGTLIELDPAEPAAVVAATEADTAAASAAPSAPPRDWFDDPQLSALTRIPTVTPEGRVYGHLEGWQDCHVSFPSYCQTPWRSACGYGYFHVCETTLADGSTLAVGPLAAVGGHYPSDEAHARQWQNAQAHYDDPTTCVAYVRVGEDEHGKWFAGALRPGVSAEQVAVFRSHRLSTDHRRIGGHMELVGANSVNVPGFVSQMALVASAGGVLEPVAAITAAPFRAPVCECGGTCGHCTTASAASDDVEARLAAAEATIAVLTDVLGPQVRQELRGRLRS